MEYKEYTVDDLLDFIIAVDIERANLMENKVRCDNTIKGLDEHREYLILKLKEEYTSA